MIPNLAAGVVCLFVDGDGVRHLCPVVAWDVDGMPLVAAPGTRVAYRADRLPGYRHLTTLDDPDAGQAETPGSDDLDDQATDEPEEGDDDY